EFMDFDRLGEEIPHLLTQLRAQARLVDRQLADGRRFMSGEAPGWVDICAYFPLWMARGFLANATAILAPLTRLPAWEARVAALGHGHRENIDAEAAWAEAHAAEPQVNVHVDADDPLGLTAGQRVRVAADDYGRDPVEGTLLVLDLDEVVVLRETRELGRIAVHFPRMGYRVSPA
ncbi:MAG: glutathione S-transferase family protein, partial [Gammaproteobacteria bacterium]|nr:glutathione S-transferase family protein [Gammaproteobacteria bacterium]